MTRRPSIAWGDRRRYLAVVVLSLGAVGFTGILSFSQSPVFQPYFRNISPPLAVTIIGILGVVSLSFLSSRRWFEMALRWESLRGVAWSPAFATLFAVVIVLVDLVVVFPYQHVPPPQSLLFYLTMAYVAEIVFHALPLSIFLALLGPLLKGQDSPKLLWLCIILTSCLQPIFQLSRGFSEIALSWADAYVGLHVCVFNVLQLSIFRRYGFVSMYACRLVYYLYWHVVWGSLRQYLLPV